MNRQILYNSLLYTLPLPLLVLDKNQKIIFSNKSFYSFLGELEKEVESETGQKITSYEEMRRCIEQVQKEGGHRELELHIEHTAGNGSVLRVIVSKLSFAALEEQAAVDENVPCPPAARRIDGGLGRRQAGLLTSHESGRGTHSGPSENEPSILLILEDITDRIRMEEQLIQSEKLAGMAQLAASIAHELGNPLSAMTAILQEIKQRIEKKKVDVSERIDTVLDNLKAMDELLRDLISFTPSRERHLRCADIHKAISRVLMLVSRQAVRQHIKITTDFFEDIPECWIDIRQMKQVFLNLFKNAMEAMPNGGTLRVRTRLLKKDEAGTPEGSYEKGHIVVEVADTGVGIPEDELSVVFKPFYTTKDSGSGLGLSTCRTIIEQHFGSIEVESFLGKGSTITLSIPVEGGDHG